MNNFKAVKRRIMPPNYALNLLGSIAIVLAMSLPCSAIPLLQLDILGGSYDSVNEDVFTNADTFTLRAYLDMSKTPSLNDYYLSVALTPQAAVSPAPSLGSFEISSGTTSQTIDVAGDMVWGTPPLSSLVVKDLPTHSIFDTYYQEFKFDFISTQLRNTVNVEDDPGTAITAPTGKDTGLAYIEFNIDATLFNAPVGTGLHFDLYDIALKKGDLEVGEIAPFSHDAQYVALSPPPRPGPLPTAPEPGTLVIFFGLASCVIPGWRRRKLTA